MKALSWREKEVTSKEMDRQRSVCCDSRKWRERPTGPDCMDDGGENGRHGLSGRMSRRPLVATSSGNYSCLFFQLRISSKLVSATAEPSSPTLLSPSAHHDPGRFSTIMDTIAGYSPDFLHGSKTPVGHTREQRSRISTGYTFLTKKMTSMAP